MTTLAAIVPPSQPPEQITGVATAADAAGLDQLVIFEDCFAESGIATATAMLAATTQIGVAIGLLPVPLRNVALTAMEIATLARLFPGRLTAGVGHGVQEWMAQVGAKAESPVTLLREYTRALYLLLRGQTVTVHGRYVHLDQVTLAWPPEVVPPLLVGGVGPRTAALAGELSDGVIIPGGLSLEEIQETIGSYRIGRSARPAAREGEIMVFVPVPAGSPAADVAATVKEYASAGASCAAVLAAEQDADLERFVTFLGQEVRPLVE